MTIKLNYRYQLPKGIDWPSVTEICGAAMKWGLVYFYAKYGAKKAKQIGAEAALIGKGLHSYANARYSKKSQVTVEIKSKELDTAIDNFNLFDKQFKLKPLFLEQVVCSQEHKYVGTLDYFGLLDNELVIIDWKTSKAIYAEYKLQVHAYYMALKEMIVKGTLVLPEQYTKLPIKLCIVRLDKGKEFNAKKDVKIFKPDLKMKGAFLGLLEYYNWNKNEK